jgi:hypothetical protein
VAGRLVLRGPLSSARGAVRGASGPFRRLGSSLPTPRVGEGKGAPRERDETPAPAGRRAPPGTGDMGRGRRGVTRRSAGGPEHSDFVKLRSFEVVSTSAGRRWTRFYATALPRSTRRPLSLRPPHTLRRWIQRPTRGARPGLGPAPSISKGLTRHGPQRCRAEGAAARATEGFSGPPHRGWNVSAWVTER